MPAAPALAAALALHLGPPREAPVVRVVLARRPRAAWVGRPIDPWTVDPAVLGRPDVAMLVRRSPAPAGDEDPAEAWLDRLLAAAVVTSMTTTTNPGRDLCVPVAGGPPCRPPPGDPGVPADAGEDRWRAEVEGP